MPVNLAPNHKYGLMLPASVMPACGMMGYGEVYRDLVDVSALGAMVTHPVSYRPRRAAKGARIAFHGHHTLIHTGWPNPGIRRVIRGHGNLWSRYPIPVIVHVLATNSTDVGRVAERLSSVEGVAGLELGFASDVLLDDVPVLVDAAKFEGSFPLIAKVPFDRVRDMIPVLVDTGVDALTLTAPPRAVLPRYREDDSVRNVGLSEDILPADPFPIRYLRGRLYGPARFPHLLDILATWSSVLSVPLVACGGISNAREALACLSLGADAVQIETCVWRDPTILNVIAAALAQPVASAEDVDDRSSGANTIESAT
jgi:dihydroorotate dehydrogenase (NAD+) catalytic subunit